MGKFLLFIILAFVLVLPIRAAETACAWIDYGMLIDQSTLLVVTYEKNIGDGPYVPGLRVLDLSSGATRLITDTLTEYPIGVLVSPDSRRIVFQPQDEDHSDPTLRIYDFAAGILSDFYLPNYPENSNLRTFSDYRWLPDSSGVIVSDSEYADNPTKRYMVHRPGQDPEVFLTIPHRNAPLGPFSPDGSTFVYGVQDRGHHMQIYLYDWANRSNRMVAEVDGFVSDFNWSADGQYILMLGFSEYFGHNRLLNVANGQISDVVTLKHWSVPSVFSPWEPGVYFTSTPRDESSDTVFDLHVRDTSGTTLAYIPLDSMPAAQNFVWRDQNHVLVIYPNMIRQLNIDTGAVENILSGICE